VLTLTVVLMAEVYRSVDSAIYIRVDV